MVDEERLKNLFLELVRIDSLSRKEGDVALRLEKELKALGGEVWVDDAGEKVSGNTGNLIAQFRGTVPQAQPLLLSAHMDTVVPGEGVKPVVDGDIIRSDGTTVLGGDDKAGLAIICEVLRVLGEEDIPHGDIDVVCTVCEERGLLGAKHLDTSRLRSRHGVVLDSEAVDVLLTQAPAADMVEFTIHGVEAHAGMCPEKGISAVKIAAEAIANMRLGRIDEETTANIGTVHGGLALNIVPNLVVVRGEARSHDEDKLRAQTAHMHQCCEEAASGHAVTIEGQTIIGRAEVTVSRQYQRMNVPESSPIVQLVRRAANNLGRQMRTGRVGGGCDANVLNGRGLEVVNLGCGMGNIHTVKEWVNVKDMVRAAELILETVKLNASQAEGGPHGIMDGRERKHS